MRRLCVIGLLASGCTGVIEGGGPASIAFMSPAPGTVYMRSSLGATGALVATIPIEIDVGGNAARVVITSDDRELGDASSGTVSVELRTAGTKTLTAKAIGFDGAVVSMATLDIKVSDPAAATCRDWLDLYELDYTVGPANQGVADPVTVKTPINGIAYRYNGSTTPRTSVFGDCALMKSLAEAAPLLRERGIATFVDIGVYNYRCIDQSKTPPNCTMSQHAYAKAIDIAAFEGKDGTTYSVLTDWVIDSGETCSSATEAGKDSFLHEAICALKAANVWNIVLTPNFNTAHRNHFHVDLTSGSDTIQRDATEDPIAGAFDLRALAGVHGD